MPIDIMLEHYCSFPDCYEDICLMFRMETEYINIKLGYLRCAYLTFPSIAWATIFISSSLLTSTFPSFLVQEF